MNIMNYKNSIIKDIKNLQIQINKYLNLFDLTQDINLLNTWYFTHNRYFWDLLMDSFQTYLNELKYIKQTNYKNNSIDLILNKSLKILFKLKNLYLLFPLKNKPLLKDEKYIKINNCENILPRYTIFKPCKKEFYEIY